MLVETLPAAQAKDELSANWLPREFVVLSDCVSLLGGFPLGAGGGLLCLPRLATESRPWGSVLLLWGAFRLTSMREDSQQ